MQAVVNSYAPVGKEATFAVSISDKFGNKHDRVVPLKLKSRYQAELAAIKYVLQAVSNKDVSLCVKTSISQLPQIFAKAEDGSWVKRKKPNKLISEVRDLASEFSEFSCVKADDEEEIEKLKEMAKTTNRI